MLTRLRVNHFKNLVDVDLRLGPLTCIAGPNGVGKSNLFDVIAFLSALADKPFVEAAREVRGGEEPRRLCPGMMAGELSIDADMIIPPSGTDDFGQNAEASTSYVRYSVRLRVAQGESTQAHERFQLVDEELRYIPKSESSKALGFHTTPSWRNSTIIASPRRRPLISTDLTTGIVSLSSDRMPTKGKSKRGGGKASRFVAEDLPRTVLSSAQNAEENRTAVLVRQEMRRWRQFQLEPSALRKPDSFQDPDTLSVLGSHVASTLFRIAHSNRMGSHDDVYSKLANRLARLIEGVHSVRVDRDEVRRTFNFILRDSAGLELPASSLSDGTMRFVALSILAVDPDETGIVCLEEPENGIHPQRITAMLDLLYDIAVDQRLPIGEQNPLRQVIVTTHSPVLVRKIYVEDLVMARRGSVAMGEGHQSHLELLGVRPSWRARLAMDGVSKGAILEYLEGSQGNEPDREGRLTVEGLVGRQNFFPWARTGGKS